MNRPKSSPMD